MPVSIRNLELGGLHVLGVSVLLMIDLLHDMAKFEIGVIQLLSSVDEGMVKEAQDNATVNFPFDKPLDLFNIGQKGDIKIRLSVRMGS